MSLLWPLPALLWAQWRSFVNLRAGESRAGRFLPAALALLWYALWTSLALGALVLLSKPARAELAAVLPWGLMSVFLYWQLAPVLAASLGASLDFRKLLIYPVPENRLFLAEVLLRLATGPEMALVLTGAALGLLRNPAVPAWAPLAALPLYALFNLLAAAGMRGLLERVLTYRRVREALAVLLVLAAAAPQLLVLRGPSGSLPHLGLHGPSVYWPWVSFGRLAAGWFGPQDWVLAALWSTAAYLFGRWQFGRSLRFDPATRSAEPPRPRRAVRGERRIGLPLAPLADPLGAILEKELRSLARSPRFRLVFLMGFSFGFLIWAPLARRPGGGFSENYPVLVSVYALLLLAEVLFWNMFGFDRAAASLWLLAPVSFRGVLAGKNLAGAVLVTAEVTVVLAVCAVLGVPLRPLKVLEAYGVTLTLCLYLLAAGNLSSLRFPRPVNPEHSWSRASAGRLQMLLLLLYPALGAPVALAYLARWAGGGDAVFFAVLAGAAGGGALFYRASLAGAVRLAERRKELFVRALTEGGGPLLTQ
jgi:ABC-2 type transport system permease protein